MSLCLFVCMHIRTYTHTKSCTGVSAITPYMILEKVLHSVKPHTKISMTHRTNKPLKTFATLKLCYPEKQLLVPGERTWQFSAAISLLWTH